MPEIKYHKLITYCGQQVMVACDGQCNKAWGLNGRPKTADENDKPYLRSDVELGEAPQIPGSWEGGDTKPLPDAEKMNRWCVRECERCEKNKMGTAPILENINLTDYSVRQPL